MQTVPASSRDTDTLRRTRIDQATRRVGAGRIAGVDPTDVAAAETAPETETEDAADDLTADSAVAAEPASTSDEESTEATLASADDSDPSASDAE